MPLPLPQQPDMTATDKNMIITYTTKIYNQNTIFLILHILVYLYKICDEKLLRMH